MPEAPGGDDSRHPGAKFDVIVIGSGFGGAVTACRLAQQGRNVLVLERGRRWQPEEYPSVSNRNWFWSESNPERHHGWIDLRLFGDMSVVAGCGVGGGSLIYANVSVDAKPVVFENGWPQEIRYDALKPFYFRVEQMLKPMHLPESQWTPRTRLLQEAANTIGAAARFSTVPQAITFAPDFDPLKEQGAQASRLWINDFGQPQGTCIHCGQCDTGCAVRAKNTLDLNYLAVAEQNGAEIRPLHHVLSIAPDGDGYSVRFRDLAQRRDGELNARNVVISAGSIGSTQLLLMCRDRWKTLPDLSPMLGKSWSANGDFVTLSHHPDRHVAPTRGPTISACIDFLDDAENPRMFIEDGGFPDMAGILFHSRPAWFKHMRAAATNGNAPFNHVMPWFGQACDASSGEMYLGRRWYLPWRRDVLRMHWDAQPNIAAMEAVSAMHRRLAVATGGRSFTPPTWTLLRNLVTPHPLGGCAMAADREHGVVDHAGAVFGYPGLYVVDGAMVPTSLGINPSKTIAALAERAAGFMRV